MIILALFVGYGLGKRGEPASDSLTPFKKIEEPNSMEEASYKEKYFSMRSRFEQVSKVDMEEYVQLKSQKEKYNKANQILGKMLIIFLAELGLKISGEARDYAEGVTNSPEKYAYKESAETKEFSKKNLSNPSEEGVARGWIKKESSLKSINSREEAIKFLEEVTFKNFSKSVEKSIFIKEKHFQMLRGTYVGEIQITQPKTQTLGMEMTIEGASGQWREEGKTSIKLFKNGQLESENTGSGQPKGYRSLSENSTAIIIHLGGSRGFVQLYRARSLGNTLIGNYYRQKEFGQVIKAGTVFLSRR